MNRISRIWLAALMTALVLGLALTGCSRSSASPDGAEEGYNVGNLAPGFGLQTPGGQTISLNDFRGRPVLLNFWATWCPPCRAEMPLLQRIADNKALSEKGLVVVGVDLGETPATVDAFMKSNGYSFTVVLDRDQIVGEHYNVGGIPTTFFIDKDGIIREVRVGAFASEAQILAGLRKIMP